MNKKVKRFVNFVLMFLVGGLVIDVFMELYNNCDLDMWIWHHINHDVYNYMICVIAMTVGTLGVIFVQFVADKIIEFVKNRK